MDQGPGGCHYFSADRWSDRLYSMYSFGKVANYQRTNQGKVANYQRANQGKVIAMTIKVEDGDWDEIRIYM